MKAGINIRWQVVTMFFFASVISYIDRQVLSVNAPLVREQFGLTNADYSYLVTAFLVAYTIGYTVLGIVVDRLGTRVALAIFAVSWSIAGMLHAFVAGVLTLALCRFILGFFEGGSLPAALRGISEWFPARERSTAIGIYAAGTPIGTMIAAPVIAFVTLMFGWRTAFVAMGALGFVWLMFWLRIFHLPEKHPRVGAEERSMIIADRAANGTPAHGGHTLKRLLRKRETWAIVVSHSLFSPVWWFYVFWLPAYLHDERGFTLQEVGGSAWIPFLTGALGTIFGGWLSSRILKRTGSVARTRYTVFLIASIGSLLGIPAALVSEPWICVALISVVTFALCIWAIVMMALPADIVPPALVGSLSGLSGSGGAIGGVLFTLATGWIVDNIAYWPVFFLAAIMPLCAVGLLYVTMPKIEQLDFGNDGSA